MSRQPHLIDLVTPIKDILADKHADQRRDLRRLIYRWRKIHNRHLGQGRSIDETVSNILDPTWRSRVRRFDVNEWCEAADDIWRRTKPILGPVPRPRLVLFPGFGSFNGRVYRLDGRPVIGCAPDFPRCTGTDLKILVTHEYAHFVRWMKTGIPYENAPVYASIYEEGWAIWVSTKLLPTDRLSRLFMSNLHKEINRPDPKGGYLAWCRKNLMTVARQARRVLKSREPGDLGRLFYIQRLRGKATPIRTGYYLGYALIAMLSETMSPRQLLMMKPTPARIAGWIDALHG